MNTGQNRKASLLTAARRGLAMALVLFACAAPGFSGCAAREFPQMRTAFPRVNPWESPAPAPTGAPYEGLSIKISLVDGLSAYIPGDDLAGIIMENWGVRRLETQAGDSPFANKLYLVDSQDTVHYEFEMASDGKPLLKDGMGRVFYMPEYAYYSIENQLTPYGLSLRATPVRWASGSANSLLQMEYYLPHIILGVKVPQIGYAQAYFTNITLYGANLSSSGDSVKLYMLVAVAGYDMVGTVFTRTIRDIRPASLTLIRQPDGSWLPTTYLESADTNSFESIRQALPYDYATQAVEAMRDNAAILKDLRHQAAEYLRISGLGKYAVEGS